MLKCLISYFLCWCFNITLEIHFSSFPLFQVSWIKHTESHPRLLALNNLSNSLDMRVTALVGEDWSKFVLKIKEVQANDKGDYECQVSGSNHTSLVRHTVGLRVLSTSTTIDNGPDIYVGLNSKLELTCRINTAGIPLQYVIWRRGNKVIIYSCKFVIAPS